MNPVFDLIVIGAGPAGLAAAVEARRGSLERVLVLEKGTSHSQMIRTFYKEGKRVDASYAGLDALCFGVLCLRNGNRESYLAMMDHVVQQEKISIEYHSEVRSLNQLENGNLEIHTALSEPLIAKSVVVAIGRMNKPTQPDYWRATPSSLKANKKLLFDINSRTIEGERVLIVGGGDSAAEYAQMLSPKNEVTLSYRKNTFSRMNPLNLRMTDALIQESQIRTLLSSNIVSIVDSEGNPEVHFLEPALGVQKFDCVIFALGGMTPIDFLRTAKMAHDEKGEAKVTEDYESSVPGVYVIGDLLGKGKGGGSIIASFNSASVAVRSLLKKYFEKELSAPVVSLEHLRF
jgi:thioredoxin reductase (NADPH)